MFMYLRPPEPAFDRTQATADLITLENADLSKAKPVQPGNLKLGKIPCANLRAIADCPNCRYCKADCYAVTKTRHKPTVKVSLTRNRALLRYDRAQYFERVSDWLEKENPRFFRIHSSGDFLGTYHLAGWLHVTKVFPDTQFLAFTKSFRAVDQADKWLKKASNVSPVLSMWPGMPEPPLKGYPKAWLQDGTETRIPKDALECPGSCETCHVCWHLKELGRDVWFRKH